MPVPFQKGSTLLGKTVLLEDQILSVRVGHIRKRGKNENDVIVPPESVLINLDFNY